MTWWIALSSFAGGAMTASLAAWVSLRGQRQNARGEWRARLDRVIDLATADSAEKQRIGDELLSDLINSDLGSPDDRALALRVARIRAGDHGLVTGVDSGTHIGDNQNQEEAR